jgi:hypothetical protein
LEYYLFHFFTATANYIAAVLLTEPLTPLTLQETSSHIIKRNLDQFKFTITQYGFQEGFTLQDLDYMIKCWVDHGKLDVAIIRYKTFTNYFSKSLFFAYLFSWLNIVLSLSSFNHISFIFGFNL